MDKYEYNLKLDEIKALVGKQDYAGAASICDTIDWRKVRSNNTLNMVADAYEATKQYDKAKNALLIAYERTPLGRQLAYRLTILSIKEKNLEEAEEFYEDFLEVSPRDMARYLLQYQLAKAKGTDIDVLIGILEKYSQEDVDERWQYELAVLYHRAGYKDKCIALCDEMILWFGDGKYVEKALELKMLYEPLTRSQQEKYNKQQEERAQRAAQSQVQTKTLPQEVQQNKTQGKQAYRQPMQKPQYVQGVQPLQSTQSIQNVQSVQDTQSIQNVQSVQDTQPIQNVQSVQDIQPIQYVAPVQETQPMESVAPVQNMQPMENIAPIQNEQLFNEFAESVTLVEDMEKGGTEKQMNTYVSQEPNVQPPILDKTSRRTSDIEYRLNANGSIVSKAAGSGDVSDVVPAEMLREKLEEQEREAAKREEEKRQEVKRVIAERMAQQEALAKAAEASKAQTAESKPVEKINEVKEVDEVKEAYEKGPQAHSTQKLENDQEINVHKKELEIHSEDESLISIQQQTAHTDELELEEQTVSEENEVKPQPEVEIKPISAPAEAGFVSEVYTVKKETAGAPEPEENISQVNNFQEKAENIEHQDMSLSMEGQQDVQKQQAAEQQEATEPLAQKEEKKQTEQTSKKGSTNEEEMLDGSTGELVKNLGNKIRANAIQEEYNRVNLQEEIAKSMASILGNLHLSHEDEEEEEEPEITTTKRIPDIKEETIGDTQRISDISQLKEKLQPVNAMSEQPIEDEQIEGQLSLEDVMAQFASEPLLEENQEEKEESISYFTRPIFGEEFTAGIKEALGEDAAIEGEMMEKMEEPEDLKEQSQNIVAEELVTEEYLEQMEPVVENDEEEYQAPVFNVQSFRNMEKPEEHEEEEQIKSALDQCAAASEALEDIGKSDEDLVENQEEKQEVNSGAKLEAKEEVLTENENLQNEETVLEEEQPEYSQPERYSRQDTQGQRNYSLTDEENQMDIGQSDQYSLQEEANEQQQVNGNENEKDLLETAEDAFEDWYDKKQAPAAMEEKLSEQQSVKEEYHIDDPALEKMRQKKEEKKNKNKGKKRIPENKRSAFASFLEIKDLEEQIASTLENLAYHSSNDGTSSTNNVMIAGEAKSGKTTLALEIIKTSNKDRSRTGRKVAKVKGTTLNKRGIKNVMAKLLGTDLIIEQAGSLMPQQVSELIDTLNGYTGNMLVVLEDDKVAIDRLIELHPKLAEMFSNQIVIKEYDINEWVRIAKEYAQSQDYGVDEMGTLALYAKINDVYGKKKEIEKNDVQMIIDDAIKHSEKKNIGKLFEIVFSRKYKDSDLTMLRESDFQ